MFIFLFPVKICANRNSCLHISRNLSTEKMDICRPINILPISQMRSLLNSLIFDKNYKLNLDFSLFFLHFQTMQYFSLNLYTNHPLRHLVNYTVNKIIPFQFNSAHHDMAPDLIWKIMAPFIIYVRRRLFMKYGSKL